MPYLPLSTLRRCRQAYHNLTPRERCGMTIERLTAIRPNEGNN